MKIAIIGRGTSAIISALICLKRGHAVEIFYDPNKPFLSVGESTTPLVSGLIYDVLKLSIGDLIDENIVSLKNSVKFINWGKGKDFFHYFQSNASAFHFESSIFNDFLHNILKSIGIKYHEYEVDNLNIVQNNVVIDDNIYDFVIKCTGWSSEDSYYEPFLKTVNSAILHVQDGIEEYNSTLHKATFDGWQFGLPFPKRNITKCGYLYNSETTDIKELEDLFKNVETKNISWKPKYSKKIVERNKKVAYNGNRLFFFEPLQALSLHYYIIFGHLICDFFENPTDEEQFKTNSRYLSEIIEYQHSLAYHYMHGSIFLDSPFWEKTTSKAKTIFEYTNQNFHLSSFLENLISDHAHNTSLVNVGVFDFYDLRSLYCGMNNLSLNNLIESHLSQSN